MITAQFPRKAAFLKDPHRYKVLYGGRDGTKSRSMAQQLVINLAERPLRWLCCRETMASMKESVHALLGDTIVRLGLQDRFNVKETEILGRYQMPEAGTGLMKYPTFLFAGIKDAKNIKSYEDCDGAWVEEAQGVSKASWKIIIPTLRKIGSEIWVSFNPELSTDETYVRFVTNQPKPDAQWIADHPGQQYCVVVKIGWEDNAWLSETSRVEIADLRVKDPSSFEHVYGGHCKSEIEGAIFRTEMRKALEEGRITNVPYNRMRPVDTAWDLGFGDLTTIWFLQAYDGWYNFIDYEQGSGLTIADYLIKLQERKYLYGVDWLPHDGVDTIVHHKLAGTGDRSKSIEMLMRAAGRNVRIAPKLFIVDRINAARTVFPQCRFDSEKCTDGLNALRHYAWESQADFEKRQKDRDRTSKREPLHNWASHGADGFQAATIAVKQPVVEEPQEPEYVGRRRGGSDAWMR